MSAMKCSILLLAICCFVIPTNGQTAGKNANADKKHSDNSQALKSEYSPDITPRRTQAVTPIVTAARATPSIDEFCKPEQDAAQRKGGNNGNKPPFDFHKLVTEEALPNTILCAVGILGIIAAFFTLLVLKKQVSLMAGSIHVDGVRVIELQEGQTPIFFVKVMNSGMTARQVSMTMAIDILGDVTKYQDSLAMMIPAQGARDFFISSGIIINNALLQKLDGHTLRVRGRIAWGKRKKDTKEYCYKYNPCQLATRPEGFPQFVPCDFNMGRDMDASVMIGGVSLVGALGTVHVRGKNTPENPN